MLCGRRYQKLVTIEVYRKTWADEWRKRVPLSNEAIRLEKPTVKIQQITFRIQIEGNISSHFPASKRRRTEEGKNKIWTSIIA